MLLLLAALEFVYVHEFLSPLSLVISFQGNKIV
jgi:hypothetical protein